VQHHGQEWDEDPRSYEECRLQMWEGLKKASTLGFFKFQFPPPT